MKSVTIKDMKGAIILKLLERKSGKFELILHRDIQGKVDITVRDDQGCMVWFQKHP
jgi:hypothetical protein